jgi:hypothetical protein
LLAPVGGILSVGSALMILAGLVLLCTTGAESKLEGNVDGVDTEGE